MSLHFPLPGLVKRFSHARHLHKCREKEELCCWWRQERLRHRLPLKPRTRVLRRLAMLCRRDVPLGNDRHEVALAAQPLSKTVMLDASCRRELGSAGAAIWRSGPRHGPFAVAVCNNLEIGADPCPLRLRRPPRGTVLMDNSESTTLGYSGSVASEGLASTTYITNDPHNVVYVPLHLQRLSNALRCASAAALCSCGLHLCPRKHSPPESRAQPSANGFGNSPRSVDLAVRPVGGHPWMG